MNQAAYFVVGQCLNPCFHFVLKRFVCRLLNQALRLTSLHIEEDSGVVSPFAPDFSLAPVNVQFFEGSKCLRIFIQHQQPFTNQPFVDGNAAVEPLRAVI